MKTKRIFTFLFLWVLALSLSPQSISSQEKKPKKEPPFPHDDTPCENVEMKHIRVPDDFSISHSEGPTHAEWGARRTLSVEADGKYTVLETRWLQDQRKEVRKIISEGHIPPEAVKRIYSKVVGCGFFSMKESYRNPNVRDGGYQVLYVTANGKHHSVAVYYFFVSRFSSISSALFAEVPTAE